MKPNMYKADNSVSGLSLGTNSCLSLLFPSNNCNIKINITTIPRISGMEADERFKLNELLNNVAKYSIPIVALSIVPFGKLHPNRGQYKVLGFVHI